MVAHRTLLFAFAAGIGACSLLAPSDGELMGDDLGSGSPPTREGGASLDATTSEDAAQVTTTPDGGADAPTVPRDPASCALCTRIPPSCLSADDCQCLALALCDGGTCVSAGATSSAYCGKDSCSRSSGVVFCRAGAGYCACK